MATQPQYLVTPDLITQPTYQVRGQNDRIYPDPRLSPDNTETLTDMNLTEQGTARRRSGFTTYNSAQIASGKSTIGLIQETYSNGAELEIEVVNNAKIYTDDGTTRADVTGTAEVSTDADDRVRWTLMNNNIYATDGTKRAWSKGQAGNAAILTSSAQFAAAAGDYCKDLVTHRNMLVALNTKESGTVYPTRARWCDINPRTLVPDPTIWPADNFAEIYYSGGAIVGAVNFGVGDNSWLWVFKTDGAYPCRLEYESGYIELNVGTGATNFSPLARHSILSTKEFIWCIAKEGAVRINQDGTFRVVTDAIQKTWNALNQGRLQYAVSYVLEQEHQVHTLLSSSTNASGHDRVLVYDWEIDQVWIETYSTIINYANRILIANVELGWYGDNDGYIYQTRRGNDNGTDISWDVKMAPNDLGLGRRSKNIQNLITYYRMSSGTAQVQLQVFLNEGRLPTKTTEIATGTSLTYNSGLKYNNGVAWPGGATLINTYFVNSSGIEVMAPRWMGTGDVEIVGYSVDHELAE